MHKYLFWTAMLPFLIVPLMAKVAVSSPILATSQSPIAQRSNANDSLCYIQMPNGTTLNLDNLCQVSPANSGPVMIPDVPGPNSNPTSSTPPGTINQVPNVSKNTDFRSGSGYANDRR
jgi:hypothetical protein